MRPLRIISSRRRRRLLAEQLESRRLLAGPYAPAAGEIGSTAIALDDSSIVGWATGIADYTPGSHVDVEFQTPDKSLGPAEGIGDVVSLGRGGELTLVFDAPIRDGLGPDFAVFENSFSDTFLELGFVEVSSDGINFIRFGDDSLTASAVDAFGAIDPTEINNFAGKYRQGFGTPFDLEELSGADPSLDTTRITHVRIVDVIGDGSQLDSSGDPIFDPFPTIGSAGIDVDAVAVLHAFDSSIDIAGFEDVGATLPVPSAFRGPIVGGTNVTGPFNDTVVVGSFQSETLTFNNAYSLDFESWNQWAYSNESNTTTAGFENQFSSFAGGGADGSPTFGIGFPDQSNFFDPPTMTRSAGDFRRFESIKITNTTYAALSMRDGDAFAKKFGGDTGNDEDFLLLTMTGLDANGDPIGTVDFYLADYRFADNSRDYIVDQWIEVDLSPVANAQSLEFSITSSDVGPFGINTPAFFAVDDVTLSKPTLLVDVNDAAASEAAGTGATVLRISRPDQDVSQRIDVTLQSSEPDRLSPRSTMATIDAGERYVEVPIDLVDNDLADGDVSVVITASAMGFIENSVSFQIFDDEEKELILSIDKASVNEGDSVTVTVERNADIGAPLTVRVVSSDGDVFQLDQNVTIDPGARTTSFTTPVTDDEIDRPDTQVLVTASAPDYLGGSALINVIDNDSAALRLVTSVDTVAEDPTPDDATFELIGRTLPPESYNDGRDGPMPLSSGFRSGALDFNNVYDSAFGSWSGWAVSNTTDVTTPGFQNQFSSYVGAGGLGSDTYAVGNAFPGFVVPTIRRDPSSGSFHSIQVTNATYAALSMRDGDPFAKKFGGPTGDDPDFFKLSIAGVDAGGATVGAVEFYLADFRFTDNTLDYIVDQWTTIDLSTLSPSAVELQFSLSSSDVGMFGMNTPAYFAADNVAILDSDAPTFTVSRNTADVSLPIQISLSSGAPDKAVVPDSITIPAGQSSVTHGVKIFSDTLVDADVAVTLLASADGFGSTSRAFTVADGDTPVLTLTLLADSINEMGGEARAVLHRNVANTSGSLDVTITATADLLVPEEVSIPQGSRSVEFLFTAVDNDRVDGARIASVSANALGYPEPQGQSIVVIDDDVPPLTLTIDLDRSSLSESDSPSIVDFEDVGSRLADESFYNGDDLAGGFTSGPATFNNEFETTFGSWSGWAVSNTTDTTTPGYLNQYSANTAGGALGSPTYAVAYPGTTSPTISFPMMEEGQRIKSLMVTNTTYATESMRNGDFVAKKFGGDTGDDPDFFLLTITDSLSDHIVEFYLADFRFADNSMDYIVNDWTEIDLSGFAGAATTLSFSLSSSDNGMFGMNTPAYFAIDQLLLADSNRTAARATVTRSDLSLDQTLDVQIEIDDASELSGPKSITFEQGERIKTFALNSVDDAFVDGVQVVTVTASAPTHGSSSAMIAIEDDDVAALNLSLLTTSVAESAGDEATELIVQRNAGDISLPLEIAILAPFPDVDVPETLVLQSGERAASIPVGVSDNDVVDGDRIATLRVDADGFSPSQAELEIRDDEVAGLIVSPFNDASRIREGFSHRIAYLSLAAKPLSDVVFDAGIEPISEYVDDRFELQSPLTFTPESWDVPQLVRLRPEGDLRVEDDQTFRMYFEANQTESDSFFRGIRESLVITLEDVQSEHIRVHESRGVPMAIDEQTGVVLAEGTRSEGVFVIANPLDQSITLDSLIETQGVIYVDLQGGHDRAIIRSGRFTLVHGGDGYDVLVVDYAATFELAGFMDNRVVGFEEIVLANESDVTIDTSKLDRIITGTGQNLLIRKPMNASLQFTDAIGMPLEFEMQMVDGEAAQLVRSGTQQIHVITETPWQNVYKRWDVNRNNHVTSGDALVVINSLHRSVDPVLPAITSPDVFNGFYLDVNGDGRLTSVDALHVINEVARRASQGGQGEVVWIYDPGHQSGNSQSGEENAFATVAGLSQSPRKIGVVTAAELVIANDAAIVELTTTSQDTSEVDSSSQGVDGMLELLSV